MSLRTFVTRGRSVVPKAAAAVPPAAASSLLPWKVTDISYRPFDGFWSFNPSIHFDGETWRCVLRCADYALPDSVQIRGPYAQPHQAQTHNAMLILDPDGWKPIEIFPMQELDGAPRLNAARAAASRTALVSDLGRGAARNRGFAAPRARDSHAGQLHTAARAGAGRLRRPIQHRGGHPFARQGLGGQGAKELGAVDGAAEPRFLYAVERGILMGVDGPINERSAAAFKVAPGLPKASRFASHGPEVRMSRPVEPIHNLVRSTSPREYSGLRGGTQLQQIGEGHWLGLARDDLLGRAEEEILLARVLPVDDDGTLLAKSPTIKLAPAFGIEFAAGLAIDGDCAVILRHRRYAVLHRRDGARGIVELLVSESGRRRRRSTMLRLRSRSWSR